MSGSANRYTVGIDVGGTKVAYGLFDEEHMARYLGVWAYNLYLTLNIGRFVFGGGLVNFGDALPGGAHREMMRHISARRGFDGSKIEFLPARLGDDFGVIGARQLL